MKMRYPTFREHGRSARVLASLIAVWALPAHAQVATSIVADTSAMGTHTTTSHTGTTTLISGGTQVGGNLYQTFQTFSLASGDTARWVAGANPDSVSNVINRVTGGDRSDIYGTIDSSAFRYAEFYFINPAGVVFGATAQVNVGAGLHVSTANAIRFQNGDVLQAATLGGSVLSSAPPEAFGFVAPQGDIQVNGSALSLRGFDPLNVVTGAVELQGHAVSFNGALVESQWRQWSLSGDTLSLNGSSIFAYDAASFKANFRTITLDNGHIVFGSTGSSGIALTASEDTFLKNYSTLDTFIYDRAGTQSVAPSDQPGNPVNISAATIDVDASSIINTADLNPATDLATRLIERTAQSNIGNLNTYLNPNWGTAAAPDYAFVQHSASGEGGAVTLAASRNLTINGDIVTQGAYAGNVSLAGDNVTLAGGNIDAEALTTPENQTAGFYGHSGNSGAITVVAKDLLQVQDIAAAKGIASSVNDAISGRQGGITLTGASVEIAGNIQIQTKVLRLSDNVAAGNVDITATSGNVGISDNAAIGATATGAGAPGSVQVSAAKGNVDITDSTVSVFAGPGTQRAGAVSILAPNGDVRIAASLPTQSTSIYVLSNSQDPLVPLQSGATDLGVDIVGKTVSLVGSTERINNSQNLTGRVLVSSETSGNQAAGDVTITATDGPLSLYRADVLSETASDQIATAGTGRAGDTRLSAAQDIIAENSLVSAISSSLGDAGDIVLSSGRDLTISDRSTISSASSGGARAGGVTLDFQRSGVISGISSVDTDVGGGGTGAGRISVEAPQGTLFMTGSELVTTPDGVVHDNATRIAANTANDAGGGDIDIDVKSLSLDAGASIAAISLSKGAPITGRAGDIHISTADLLIQNDAAISTEAFSDGDAGIIEIAAQNAALHMGGQIDSDTAGHGSAGSVTLNVAQSLVIDSAARISSQSGTNTIRSAGKGGDVTVSAHDLTLANGGAIEADSTTLSDAGRVTVTADGSLTVDSTCPAGAASCLTSQIASIALGQSLLTGGNGGDVTVRAGVLSVKNGGLISAKTYSSGDGGDVDVASNTLSLDKGGNISSDTLGAGRGGTVSVSANTANLTGASAISANAEASGDGGRVQTNFGSLWISSTSGITSGTSGSGHGGTVIVDATGIDLTDGGTIGAGASQTGGAAGDVMVSAASITVDGPATSVSSSNLNPSGGLAGSVTINTDTLDLLNGGSLSTNAKADTAGSISVNFQEPGLLRLDSLGSQSRITTTSGTKSGGRIFITGPYSILMNGAKIEALGPGNAALVTISAGSIIESSDRLNSIEVAGIFNLNSVIMDIDKSLRNEPLSFIDASKVLSGQCTGRKEAGRESLFLVPKVGPYVIPLPASDRPALTAESCSPNGGAA